MIGGVRRLLPTAADNIPPIAAYVDPIRRRHSDGRPWVAVCMIASIDGSTVVDGSSGALGSPADTAVLGALRQLADMIVVGAATVRSEGYGPPKKPGQRIGVVTTDGSSLDLDSALFTSGSGFLITTDEAPDLAVDTLRAGHGRVDLRRALRRCGVDFVHVEGGPRLNAALFDAEVVDEVNLTISPHLAGGLGPRLIDSAGARLSRYDLVQLCEEGGYLFCRYVRRSNEPRTDG
jgi:riboflavin biosynthesis pyrimidine reductase